MRQTNGAQDAVFQYLDDVAAHDHGVLTFKQVVKTLEGEFDLSYFEAHETFMAWLLRMSVEDLEKKLHAVE